GGGPHIRARYRLALIAYGQHQKDVARAQLDALLASQPDHARGKALLAKIEPAAAQNPGQPPPPSGGGPPSGQPHAPLARGGNRLAENGNCGEAMRWFEKALDTKPGGVEALTGLGYCHMDRKEFGRALSSFRAALGIAPRFGDAILGMAEAYRFQGMRDEAL